jgi:hypothetical protein
VFEHAEDEKVAVLFVKAEAFDGFETVGPKRWVVAAKLVLTSDPVRSLLYTDKLPNRIFP